MVGAERLSASIAVKLVAAGTQHLAAVGIGTWVDFQNRVSAIFVVLDRKALKEGVTGGAGSGGEFRSHEDHNSLALSYCQSGKRKYLQKG